MLLIFLGLAVETIEVIIKFDRITRYQTNSSAKSSKMRDASIRPGPSILRVGPRRRGCVTRIQWGDTAVIQNSLTVSNTVRRSSENKNMCPWKIQVFGLKGRAISSNGIYLITSTILHGRPVYEKHPAGTPCPRILYDRRSGSPAWMVEVPGEPGKAYAYCESRAKSPAKLSGPWHLWACRESSRCRDGVWTTNLNEAYTDFRMITWTDLSR